MNPSQFRSPVPLKREDDGVRQYVYLTYAAFFIGLISGGTGTLVGVIMAYLRRNELRGTPYFDHLHFLIRTFWFSLLGYLICLPLLLVLIGWPLAVLVTIWHVYRLIAGLLRLHQRQAIHADGWTV